MIFPHRSVLWSSWKRLNMFSLCQNTLWMWVYFTGWFRNERTRLSYKQHVRTVFVFLLLFAMWKVLTNALMLFFCRSSSDCVAGNLKENPECVWAWVWLCGCLKKEEEEERKQYSVQPGIETMGIVSVTFFCSKCMNSSGLSELLVQDKPARCFKCLFHVLKEALVLYFLLHVAFRLMLGRSEWARARQMAHSSSVNAMRFKLLKPRTQGGLHISVIAITLFFCSSENCSFSPFSLSPHFPLLYCSFLGWIAVFTVLNMKRGGHGYRTVYFLCCHVCDLCFFFALK